MATMYLDLISRNDKGVYVICILVLQAKMIIGTQGDSIVLVAYIILPSRVRVLTP